MTGSQNGLQMVRVCLSADALPASANARPGWRAEWVCVESRGERGWDRAPLRGTGPWAGSVHFPPSLILMLIHVYCRKFGEYKKKVEEKNSPINHLLQPPRKLPCLTARYISDKPLFKKYIFFFLKWLQPYLEVCISPCF